MSLYFVVFTDFYFWVEMNHTKINSEYLVKYTYNNNLVFNFVLSYKNLNVSTEVHKTV